nr:protein TMED8 isoform X1 [Monopterus albus]
MATLGCKACRCPLSTKMDIISGLSSFAFETGLNEDDEKLLYLRARSAGLTFCGCAHAVYLCNLVHSLRCIIKSHTAKRDSVASGGHHDLCVGILGMGHMGKQLLLSLLEMTGIKSSHIQVSTRRPESAVKFVKTGVECFFDNRRLAAWSDILFLCCLPSHLPRVCADLHSHLSKHCLVYSFTSAVPVTRLARLLGHDFIVRPQYDFVACDTADVWLSCSHLTTALKDPLLIAASCPVTMTGGISLGLNWVCVVLYSLLNICTSAGLGSCDALSLINSLFKEKSTLAVQLNAQNFISSSYASSLLTEEPFPWISLTDAQTKETPLLCFLSSNTSMQQCISAAYKSLLKTPVKLEDYIPVSMERSESTSELQSRLSSLSFSSFPGIPSEQCDSRPTDRLQNTDLSQSFTQSKTNMDETKEDSEHHSEGNEEAPSEPAPGEGAEENNSAASCEKKAQMPPLMPPATWTSVALKELKEKLRPEKDSVVTVYRGDIMTVNVPTVPEAKKVCWEFATDGYDIGFGIYFDWTPVTNRSITVHISESSDDEDEEEDLAAPATNGDVEKGSKIQTTKSNLAEVLPVYRQDSHLLVHGGSHDFPGDGTYLLKFDNSYSLWRNKTLYYRVYYSD